jgi:hypothetical protein
MAHSFKSAGKKLKLSSLDVSIVDDVDLIPVLDQIIDLVSSENFTSLLLSIGKEASELRLTSTPDHQQMDEDPPDLQDLDGWHPTFQTLKLFKFRSIEIITRQVVHADDRALASFGRHWPDLSNLCLGTPTPRMTTIPGLIDLVARCPSLHRFRTSLNTSNAAYFSELIELGVFSSAPNSLTYLFCEPDHPIEGWDNLRDLVEVLLHIAPNLRELLDEKKEVCEDTYYDEWMEAESLVDKMRVHQ